MKSFHFLSNDQVAVLPFLDGGIVVLDDTVTDYFRDFFITAKARSVTIGTTHPDPSLHEPNFGGDYLYFTTDIACKDLIVSSEFPSSVNKDIRRDTLQVEINGRLWLMEMVSSPLHPRYGLAHLLPNPQDSINGLRGLEKQLVYENEIYNQPSPTPQTDLKEENEQLLAKVSTFKQLYERATVENTELKQHNAALTIELDVLRAAKAAEQREQRKTAEFDVMVNQTKEAEVQAELARKEVRALQHENEVLKKKQQNAQRELQEEQKRNAEKYDLLRKENDKLASAMSDNTDAASTIKKLKKEIETLRGKVSDQKATMAASVVENDGKIDRLQRDRDRLSAEVGDLKEKLIEKEKQMQRKAKIAKAEQQQQQIQINQLQTQSQRSRSSARASTPQRTATPKRAKSQGRPKQGQEKEEHQVTDEVVVSIDNSDRVAKELAHHQARFSGKEGVLIECLQLLYGTDEEHEIYMAKKEAEKKAREEELRALKEELQRCTAECVTANKTITVLREKEKGMAKKFLEADREYSEELLAMRRQVLTARADASLVGSELSALRRSATIMSPTLTSPHRSRSIQAQRNVVSPPAPGKI